MKSSVDARYWVNRIAIASVLVTSLFANLRIGLVPLQIQENNQLGSKQSQMKLTTGDAEAVQHRLDGRPGQKYLFFKHIRKAGGTTVANYLKAVHAYHAPIYNWTYYEQEYGAMHYDCPQLDARRWNNSVRAIVLRQPIERHLSELFYSEIPFLTTPDIEKIKRMRKARYYSKEFYRLLAPHITRWVEQGMEKLQTKGALFQHFSDDFQVRALSGETEDQPYQAPPQSICSTDPENAICTEWHYPCYYGGGFRHGGTKAWQPMNSLALERAKRNLAQFDLILLTESLSDPLQIQYAAAVLQVPTTNTSLSQSKGKVNDPKGKSAMVLGLKNATPQVYDLLEQHSQLEMELYEEAVRLNQERVARWQESIST